MNNEHIERKMKFIVEQQAHLIAENERDHRDRRERRNGK